MRSKDDNFLAPIETLYILSKADELARTKENPYKYPNELLMSSRDVIRIETGRLKGTGILSREAAIKRLRNLTSDNLIKISDKSYYMTEPRYHTKLWYTLTNKGERYLADNFHTLINTYNSKTDVIGSDIDTEVFIENL
jgi:hypothetical protein